MIEAEDIVEVDDASTDIPGAKPRRNKGGRPRGSGGTSPKTTATEYTLPLSKLCIGVSFLAALTTNSPGYVMSDQEATAIAKPAAKIFARSAIARKYGKYIAGSNDWIALGIAGFSYVQSASERQRQYAAYARGAQPSQPAYAPNAQPSQSVRAASATSAPQSEPGSGLVYADDGLPVVTIDPAAIADLTPGRGD